MPEQYNENIPEANFVDDLTMYQVAIEKRLRNVIFSPDLSEIAGVKISIEEHPEEDLAGFNELYSKVQAFRSRASSILFNMYKERGIWKSYQHDLKRIYKKIKNQTLTERTDIQKLRNKELQEAAVEIQMPITVRLLDLTEGKLEDIENEIDMVQIKLSDCDHAEMNLSRQQKIVEALIGIGYPVNPSKGN